MTTIDTNSAAALKQFVAQMTTIRDTIAAGTFPIDGNGDTLNAVVGMVVQKFGAELYQHNAEAIEQAPDETAKVVVLLDAVIKHFDEQEKMISATVGMFGKLGINSIKFV